MSFWYWLLAPLAYDIRLPLPRALYWYVNSYPNAAAVLLCAGLIALLYRRSRQLWWFLLPVGLSGGLFALALTIGSVLFDTGAIVALTTLFIALLTTIFALVRSRAAWPAGLFFATACLSVLFYQGLNSTMMLSGQAI